VISSAAAVAGGASLLVLKNKIDTEVQNQTLGLIRVSYEVGYWLALLGYGAALVLNLILRSKARATDTLAAELATAAVSAAGSSPTTSLVTEPSPLIAAQPPISTSAAKNFCGNCGGKLDGVGKFCPNCGTRV
jgi:hypothetical protein